MSFAQRLQVLTRLFLDTAPVVYYIEENQRYLSLVDPVFQRVDAGSLTVVTSPVTLAECLVAPYRQERADQLQAFASILTSGPNTICAPITWATAQRAAYLRARYNLSLPDAFQVAIALSMHCDAFLTNDAALKRISELNVIILDDLVA